MNFSFNSRNNNTIIFFKGLIDIMIPKHPKMDKASKVINFNRFLKKILKNQNLKRKIMSFDLRLLKKNDINSIIKHFADKKILDDEIGNDLIIEYFSSEIVFTNLSKINKTNDKINFHKLIKKNEKTKK